MEKRRIVMELFSNLIHVNETEKGDENLCLA